MGPVQGYTGGEHADSPNIFSHLANTNEQWVEKVSWIFATLALLGADIR